MDDRHKDAYSSLGKARFPVVCLMADRWYPVRAKLWYEPFDNLTLHLHIMSEIAKVNEQLDWGRFKPR